MNWDELEKNIYADEPTSAEVGFGGLTDAGRKYDSWLLAQREARRASLGPDRIRMGLLQKSFAKNSLAFVEDPVVRGNLDRQLWRTGDRERAGKEWCLAAYFSKGNRGDIHFCHSNLRSIIKSYFDEDLSVDEAFTRIDALLNSPPDLRYFLAAKYRKELDTALDAALCSGGVFSAVVTGLIVARAVKKRFGTMNIFKLLRKKVKQMSEKLRFLSSRQVQFLWISATAAVLLVLAMCEDGFPSGFYTFLRIIVCAALAGKCLEKFPAWARTLLFLAAVLYNPVAPVRFRDGDIWLFFNAGTLVILIAAEIFTIRKALRSKEQ